MLLALMALGIIILAYSGSRLSVTYRTPLTGCARDDGTGGASGLFRWAERIGVPVQRSEVPLWELPQVLAEPTGNCVVTMGDGPWSPMGEEMGPEDWLSTSHWIARGNALVVVTTAPESLPQTLRQDLKLPMVPAPVTKRVPFLGPGSVDSRPETTPATVTSGGSLTVKRDGPRWAVPSTQGTGAGASGPGTLSLAADSDLAQWQLAGDQQGGVLFRIPVGRGAVYILLDEFAWTNTGLDQGDNARVLAEVLEREVHGGALALDEYRHGHGRVESFLTYLVNLPGSPAFMWLAAIWVFLYVYGRNVRLKPVEAYVEEERRTAQEYIDAVAQLYERARAAPLVVEAVARRLRQAARSSAERPASVEAALLETADLTVKAGERPASPTAAIQLVRELIQLRKSLYGTRKLS